MPNYKLVLNPGDGSESEIVSDYDSEVGLPPGTKFQHNGRMWQVDRVIRNTLYCKPA
jgi:hypothetical protein